MDILESMELVKLFQFVQSSHSLTASNVFVMLDTLNLMEPVFINVKYQMVNVFVCPVLAKTLSVNVSQFHVDLMNFSITQFLNAYVIQDINLTLKEFALKSALVLTKFQLLMAVFVLLALLETLLEIAFKFYAQPMNFC
jgi:hypothetical protein